MLEPIRQQAAAELAATGRRVDAAVPSGCWFVSHDPIRGAELWRRIVDRCDPEEDQVAYALAVIAWCTAGASHMIDEAELLIPSDDRWSRAILDMTYTTFTSLAMMMNQPAPYDMSEAERRGERAATSLRYFEDQWALGLTLGELGRLKQHCVR